MVAHVALIAGVLVMPRATWAAPPAIADVAAMLSDHESIPDASVFVADGPATATTLFQVFQSEAQPTFVRVRALRVIGFFTPEVAAPLLQHVVRDAYAKPVFVREAVVGLVRCGAVEAMKHLPPLLRRPEPAVRRAVIDGLAQLATTEAKAVLSQHRVRETDSSARAAIDAALGVAGAH